MMPISRRAVLFGAAATAAIAAHPVFALSDAAATRLVNTLVGDINRVIGSGASLGGMIREFEKIFARYADVPTIARSALGPAARSASRSDLSNYTTAFRGYIARKYGRRFNEFVGGNITVHGTNNRGKFHEVQCQVKLRSSAPFGITFRVSDRSGKDLFFDLIIEGISMLSTERAEIGALLDRHGGSIPKLTQALKSAG